MGNRCRNKRFAISPQFQNNTKLATMNTRKVFSPDLAIKKNLNETVPPIDSKPMNVHEWLNSTFARDTRKEFETILEKHGGNYKPGFGYQNLFESQEHKTGWSRFLGVIKDEPTNENTLVAIKNMKGQKKVIETVQSSKYRELMLQNENILKCFVYNQLISRKNGNTQNHDKAFNRIPTRHETKDMVWLC